MTRAVPSPDGVASSKVLVTNLHNLTQPIIRYELTDRFTPAGTSEGGARAPACRGGPTTCSGTPGPACTRS